MDAAVVRTSGGSTAEERTSDDGTTEDRTSGEGASGGHAGGGHAGGDHTAEHRADVDRTALEIAELLPAVAATLRVGALFEGAASDLTANQLVALILIGRADGSRMRAGDVARRMSVSAASATALIDRLVDFGMLTRARGDDRRVVWVSVTEPGHVFIDQLKAGTVARIAAALANTPAETREQLVDSLRQVTTFAQHFTDVPPHSQ